MDKLRNRQVLPEAGKRLSRYSRYRRTTDSSCIGRLGSFDPMTARWQSLPPEVSWHDTVQAPRDRRNTARGRMRLQLPRASGSIGMRAHLSSLRSTTAGAGGKSIGYASGRTRRPRQARSERRGLRAAASGNGRADRRLAGVWTSRPTSRRLGERRLDLNIPAGDSRFGSPATRTAQGARGKAAGDRAVVSRVAAAARRADPCAGAEWSALYLGRLAADRRRQQPSTSASCQPTWKRPAAT